MPEITIPQAAVEAAAEAIAERVRSGGGTDELEAEGKADLAREMEARAALEAALPHIREALAEEVDQYAEADDADGGMGPDFYSGLYRAAHIVRGDRS